MKRFLSKKEFYIPLKVNGVWRTAHFVEVNGGFAYNSTDDEESEQIMRHSYFTEGIIRLDESEQPQPRRIAETPEGQRYYDKRGAMDVQTRIRALSLACADIPNVRVIAHGGLLVDCARENGVDAVIRGVRPLGDFETEYQMAQVNRALGGVETLLMTTSPAHASISSSIVRQIASFSGAIEDLVPAEAAAVIRAALHSEKEA